MAWADDVEDNAPSIALRQAVMRPAVRRAKTGHKPKLLTVEDVPLLLESLP